MKGTGNKIADILEEGLRHHFIVALTDKKGTILDVNDKFCEISGYQKDELVGSDHRLINSGHHSKDFWKNFWEIITRGEVFKGEIKNKRKDQSYYWVDTTVVPFFNTHIRDFYFLSIRTDITQRKEAIQRELEQTKRFADIGKLSSVNMHEVGNLFSIIDCLMWRLEKGAMDADSKDAVAKIKQALKRSSSIFQNFKRLSANQGVQKSSSADDLVSTDVTAVLRIVNDLFHYRFEQLGIQFSIDADDSHSMVVCSSDILVQVLINLLSNSLYAVKDLPDGERWVKILLSEDTKLLFIDVIDSGSGIAEQILPKLFQEFFTTKKDGEGSGVGLSYSQNILRKIGGDLEYRKDNTNTDFRITLLKAEKR